MSIVKKVKEFIAVDNDTLCQSLNKIMLENGKNEKVKFDANVIKKAVVARIEIAKKEAECYVNTYEKLKRLMTEIESDNLKLGKYQKVLKDVTVKLNFIEAEKEYIVNFLDNERMTAINGDKAHKQMMQEACENFDLDMAQINNLYNLVLREIAGKSTKKAYKELYNSTYLADIEETEKTFNQEVNNIRANIGTIINTNYWRIEGIKNLYEVFNNEVEEKFERDLSEFMPEEKEEIEEPEQLELDEEEDETVEDDTEEWFITNNEVNEKGKDDDEYEDEDEDDDEYKDDEYADEDDDEYEDDEYEDDEYADEDDDEYEDDEYEDEDKDEYEADEYEDEDDDEYEDDEYEDEDEYEDDEYEDDEDEEDDEYGDDEDDEIEKGKYDEDEDEDEDDEDDEKEIEEVKKYIKNKTKNKSRSKGKKKEEIEKKSGIFEKIFKEKKKQDFRAFILKME